MTNMIVTHADIAVVTALLRAALAAKAEGRTDDEQTLLHAAQLMSPSKSMMRRLEHQVK